MRFSFFKGGRRAEDGRRTFLGDAAGGARAEVLSTFDRYLDDPAAADEDVQDIDDLASGWVREDAILLHVAFGARIVTWINWKTDATTMLDQIAPRLALLGAAPIEADDRGRIERYVEGRVRERGDAVGLAYGPLVEPLRQRSLAAIALDLAADGYPFVVVPEPIGRRWRGQRLSEAFVVVDPAEMFEEQLAGSPYAHLLELR